MSCMRDEILSEAAVDLVDRYSVISSSDTFKVGDLCCLYRMIRIKLSFLYRNFTSVM